MAKNRDALISEHLDWAQAIARHVASLLPTRFSEDDLTGPAEVALVKLANRYDPGRDVTFRVFAQRRIYGACLDSIRRKEYTERNHVPLNGKDPIGQAPTPEQIVSAARYIDVWTRVQGLPPRHALVILAHYAGDMTLVQIAALIGVGAARVSQVHTEALAMLRGRCEDLDEA